jgi:hypothetical protein
MVRKAAVVLALSSLLSLTGGLAGGAMTSASPGGATTSSIPPRCC